uniref:Uncharacterized protein n=1 Tax=Steinernema glaseri TaxID=37863 RepID=A0A1I8ATQ1_9BILA
MYSRRLAPTHLINFLVKQQKETGVQNMNSIEDRLNLDKNTSNPRGIGVLYEETGHSKVGDCEENRSVESSAEKYRIEQGRRVMTVEGAEMNFRNATTSESLIRPKSPPHAMQVGIAERRLDERSTGGKPVAAPWSSALNPQLDKTCVETVP